MSSSTSSSNGACCSGGQTEGGTRHLSIGATLHDFILLATRKEDPDTLFFNRRLMVEGDTELGLVTKNTLDAIELPKMANLQPVRVLNLIRQRLAVLQGMH